MFEFEIPFPSPIGESYFSIDRETSLRWKNITFPSPIGESYFSINCGGF